MSDPTRYIKLPIRIYDADEEKEKLGIIDTLVVKIRVLPFCIESYHPAIPQDLEWKPENLISTRVMMKSGDEYIVDMDIFAFDNLLNAQ